jgi:hypothetical protein
MGWNAPDLYNQPEHFSVKLLGDIEWDYEMYRFNMTAVWVDALGQFYVGDDSGCSCPFPFENFTSAEDLGMPMTRHEVADMLVNMVDRMRSRAYMSDEDKSNVEMSAVELVNKLFMYKGDNG